MLANYSLARWEQLQINVQDECLTVYDNLAKRKRVYHVPYLLHAELVQNIVYIFTSNAKIMQLDLLTAARQFLNATQLKNLTQVRKTAKMHQIS